MFLSRDNLIVLGILVVVATTYFAVVNRIQSAAADEVSSQMSEVQKNLKADTEQTKRVPPMIRQIKEMKRRYNDEDWGQRLPERQELAGFLHEIASGLSEENLTNQYIQPGNPTQGRLYNCLPITLSFGGDFLSLARFLKRIDGMTRLVRIERLTINAGEDTQKLQIEMGMSIYFTEQRTR